MPGGFDDRRHLNLTGPFRALYRAAREAGQVSADDAPQAEAPDPPDPIHAAIRRQVEELLADTDIAPEQRREIFDSIACPCCGGTGASFAIAIKPASRAGF